LAPDEGLRDEALLQAFLGGDQDAFTTLMRRYENRIFGLCRRLVGDRADALDATQEAFISAFRRAHTFRGEAAFGTWLYRIGINSCHDLLRKRGRLPTPEDSETLAAHAPSGVPPNIEETVSLNVDLRAALAELSPDYREAVVMHDIGGIPYEEIAEATGVAIGTVKSRISRGRRKLADALEQPRAPQPSKRHI
jgi:RNA polymerase sigma-70 factor (ECF subfamily)